MFLMFKINNLQNIEVMGIRLSCWSLLLKRRVNYSDKIETFTWCYVILAEGA